MDKNIKNSKSEIEFNLSKCIKKDFFDENLYRLAPFIDVIDVEEFIETIKKNISRMTKGNGDIEFYRVIKIINKIAGNKLQKDIKQNGTN